MHQIQWVRAFKVCCCYFFFLCASTKWMLIIVFKFVLNLLHGRCSQHSTANFNRVKNKTEYAQRAQIKHIYFNLFGDSNWFLDALEKSKQSQSYGIESEIELNGLSSSIVFLFFCVCFEYCGLCELTSKGFVYSLDCKRQIPMKSTQTNQQMWFMHKVYCVAMF